MLHVKKEAKLEESKPESEELKLESDKETIIKKERETISPKSKAKHIDATSIGSTIGSPLLAHLTGLKVDTGPAIKGACLLSGKIPHRVWVKYKEGYSTYCQLVLGGELCKYPDHDEWIQSFSHLQPSKLEEHVSMPSQHQHITNIDIDGLEDEQTNVNANATNILNEVSVEEKIERDNTQFEIVHKTLTNNTAQTIDTPTLSSQEEAEPHQTNEVFNSEQSFSTSQPPHEGELRQDGMASSSSCAGIPPPPHNATSTSTHPMITRSRAGKHTGHIKTDFSKHGITTSTVGQGNARRA
ncbi:hypothetical protein SLEP1_g54613 [Rubroshorea leprosula]|uniref:Uncharacterized protein n=1 Tax=Rubroshorea leprosula TaxID=152421 RepID=A0AAV5MD58_9ROSI|nr:hypothetical protein SLEP1_g54613 [Rubroshorea leprosula]